MKLLTSILCSLTVILGFSVSGFGGDSGRPLTPAELLAPPDPYLGKTITVQIVEPLYGPGTEAALKSAAYGGMEVMIPDGGGRSSLKLVPAAFKPEDPNRFKRKFDRVMQSPVRVTGVLFSKPGAHYGHLGGYSFEILATKVEFLNPS